MRVAAGPVLMTALYQRNHSAGRRLHAAATKQIVAGSQPSLIGCARTITAAPSRTTNSTNGPMLPEPSHEIGESLGHRTVGARREGGCS